MKKKKTFEFIHRFKTEDTAIEIIQSGKKERRKKNSTKSLKEMHRAFETCGMTESEETKKLNREQK